jgi:hypothetical protein
VIIAIYMVVNLSCLVFYLRERRGQFNLLLHGLIPLLGIAAFVPAFLTAVGSRRSTSSAPCRTRSAWSVRWWGSGMRSAWST